MTLLPKRREKDLLIFSRYEKDRRSRFNALLNRLATLLPNYAECNSGVRKWTKAEILTNAINYVKDVQSKTTVMPFSERSPSNSNDPKDKDRVTHILKRQNKRLREILRREYTPHLNEKEFCALEFGELYKIIEEKKREASVSKENDSNESNVAKNDAGDVFVVSTDKSSSICDHTYSLVVQQEAEVEVETVEVTENQEDPLEVDPGEVMTAEHEQQQVPLQSQNEEVYEEVVVSNTPITQVTHATTNQNPVIFQLAPSQQNPLYQTMIPIQTTPVIMATAHQHIPTAPMPPPNKLPLPRTYSHATTTTSMATTSVPNQPWRLPKPKFKRKRRRVQGNVKGQQAASSSSKEQSETKGNNNENEASDVVNVSASLPKQILASEEPEQEIIDLTRDGADLRSSSKAKPSPSTKTSDIPTTSVATKAKDTKTKAKSSYSIAALCQMSTSIGGDPKAGGGSDRQGSRSSSSSTSMPKTSATTTPASTAKSSSAARATSSKDEEIKALVPPTSPTKSYLTQFPVVKGQSVKKARPSEETQQGPRSLSSNKEQSAAPMPSTSKPGKSSRAKPEVQQTLKTTTSTSISASTSAPPASKTTSMVTRSEAAKNLSSSQSKSSTSQPTSSTSSKKSDPPSPPQKAKATSKTSGTGESLATTKSVVPKLPPAPLQQTENSKSAKNQAGKQPQHQSQQKQTIPQYQSTSRSAHLVPPNVAISSFGYNYHAYASQPPIYSSRGSSAEAVSKATTSTSTASTIPDLNQMPYHHMHPHPAYTSNFPGPPPPPPTSGSEFLKQPTYMSSTTSKMTQDLAYSKRSSVDSPMMPTYTNPMLPPQPYPDQPSAHHSHQHHQVPPAQPVYQLVDQTDPGLFTVNHLVNPKTGQTSSASYKKASKRSAPAATTTTTNSGASRYGKQPMTMAAPAATSSSSSANQKESTKREQQDQQQKKVGKQGGNAKSASTAGQSSSSRVSSNTRSSGGSSTSKRSYSAESLLSTPEGGHHPHLFSAHQHQNQQPLEMTKQTSSSRSSSRSSYVTPTKQDRGGVELPPSSRIPDFTWSVGATASTVTSSSSRPYSTPTKATSIIDHPSHHGSKLPEFNWSTSATAKAYSPTTPSKHDLKSSTSSAASTGSAPPGASTRLPDFTWADQGGHFAPFPSISPSPNLFGQDFGSFDFTSTAMFGTPEMVVGTPSKSGRSGKESSSSRSYSTTSGGGGGQVANVQHDFDPQLQQQGTGQQVAFDPGFFHQLPTIPPPSSTSTMPPPSGPEETSSYFSAPNIVMYGGSGAPPPPMTTSGPLPPQSSSSRSSYKSSRGQSSGGQQMHQQQPQPPPHPQHQQQQPGGGGHQSQRHHRSSQQGQIGVHPEGGVMASQSHQGRHISMSTEPHPEQQLTGYPVNQQLILASGGSSAPVGASTSSSYINFNLSTLFPEISEKNLAVTALLPTVPPPLPSKSSSTAANQPSANLTIPALPPVSAADFSSKQPPSASDILPHSFHMLTSHPGQVAFSTTAVPFSSTGTSFPATTGTSSGSAPGSGSGDNDAQAVNFALQDQQPQPQ